MPTGDFNPNCPKCGGLYQSEILGRTFTGNPRICNCNETQNILYTPTSFNIKNNYLIIN